MSDIDAIGAERRVAPETRKRIANDTLGLWIAAIVACLAIAFVFH
jgi:hypothetical protein